MNIYPGVMLLVNQESSCLVEGHPFYEDIAVGYLFYFHGLYYASSFRPFYSLARNYL